jgi:hypothetical protein
MCGRRQSPEPVGHAATTHPGPEVGSRGALVNGQLLPTGVRARSATIRSDELASELERAVLLADLTTDQGRSPRFDGTCGDSLLLRTSAGTPATHPVIVAS